MLASNLYVNNFLAMVGWHRTQTLAKYFFPTGNHPSVVVHKINYRDLDLHS